MRRAVTVLALSAAVLTPGAAWAQQSPTPSHTDFGSPSPTPSPTLSPSHRDPACPSFKVEHTPGPIDTGQSATVTVTIADGEKSAFIRMTRLSPAPVAAVRNPDVPVQKISFVLRLGETHRFAVDASRGDSCIGGGTGIVRFAIPVAPSLTIAAVRNAPRDYSFTGRILPGRGQLVTLYRHDAGRRTITAQSRVQPDGLYRFDRRFTGSGEFGFSVAVGTSATNVAGESRVRPTVIH